MGIRALSALIVGLLTLAACGDNIEPPDDPDQVVNVELDTFAPTQVTAGDTISVTCTLHENDITTMVPAQVKVVDDTKVRHVADMIVAHTVGTIAVSCNLPER